MKQNSTQTQALTDKEAAQGEAEVFTLAIQAADEGGPIHRTLYNHFCQELHKAVDQGRITTTERMIALYPILREINLERERGDWEYEMIEAKDKKRAAKKGGLHLAEVNVSQAGEVNQART